MTASDPIFEKITGPGSPFEVGEADGMRRFVSAPPDLNMLIEGARRHGDATFIVEGDRRLTFNDMFKLRDALAGQMEIQPGDHVAICMRNRAEWMIGFLAVVRAGGVAALVNSRGSPEELAAAVKSVDAKLVLADSPRDTLIREGGYHGRIIGAEDFREDGPPPPDKTPANPHDPAVILFTSGTTGRVKGAVLSHHNIITGIMLMQLSGLMVLHDTAAKMGVEIDTILANMPQQGVLQVFPLFHISGLGAAFLSPFFAGSKVVIMRRWNGDEALEIIEREQITQFTGVPTMLWDALHAMERSDAKLDSLRNIGIGGQAMPVNLLDAMRAACPQAVMGTGYGMTECAGSVAMAVGEDYIRNRAAAGRVLNLVDMRILGPEGEELPCGEAGEIVVRGPMVMQGYWNNQQATDEVLSTDGWLNTGDVGYIDEEGYVFIVDRKKDMVISGGENIYCAEVERVMGEMPEIVECAAFGIPDERLGEMMVAVVLADGITGQQIIDNVGERLAKYKAPGKVILAGEPLPRNPVGKIDKKQLRESWQELAGEKA